jgi:hypothetical protein
MLNNWQQEGKQCINGPVPKDVAESCNLHPEKKYFKMLDR